MNIRFLTRVGLSVLALTSLVHLVHALQVRRLQSHLKAEAERAAADGELDRSALYYSRYLANRPDDLETLADYGLLLHRRADSHTGRWRAYRVLTRVLQRDPNMHRVRLPLAHLTVALGHYRQAVDYLEPLRGTLAEQCELEQTLAWCYQASGRTDLAIEALNRAIGHAPERPEPYVQLSEVYRRQRLTRAADQVLARMVEANPDSARVYRARGEALMGQGRFEEAAADLDIAIGLAPEELPTWLLAAEISRLRQRPADVRTILDRGLERHPDHPRLLQFLAWAERDIGEFAAAGAALDRALTRHPEDVELWTLRADLALEQGRPDEAERALAEVRRRQPDSIWTRYLAARMETDKVKAARALEASAAELAVAPAWQSRALLALARSYAAVGDEMRRVQSYRRAVLADSAGRQARLALGLALRDNHEPAAARETLAAVQQGPAPLPQAWLPLARAAIESESWDEAERALRRATRPQDAAAVAALQAQLWAARGETARAREILAQAGKDHPKSVEVWTQRIELAEAAEAVLTEAKRHLGDRVELRLAQARLTKQADGARALTALSRDTEGFSSEERVALYAGLEPLLRQVGAVASLEELARRWSLAAPDHLGALLLSFDLAVEKGDAAEAERLLTRARHVEGEEGVRWRCGLALMALAKAQRGDRAALGQARTLLAESARRQPDWSRLAVLQARLEELEGRPLAALPHYRRAFDAGDRFPWLTERLVQLLVGQGKLIEADRVLSRFQEGSRPSPGLARLGADAALQRREWARARELALLAVADSGDYRDHLWLAEVQELAGHRDEARAILERLTTSNGDLPEPWIALVRHLVRADDRPQAETVLKRAESHVAAERLDWLRARAYEELGELERAEAAYRQGLETAADKAFWHERLARLLLYQDDPARALPSLRWLADPRTQTVPAVAAWAQRMQALAHVGLLGPEPTLGAGPEKRSAALRLLAQNTSGGKEGLADRRARLMIQLSSPTALPQAHAELEATRAEAPFTAEEQYRLGLIEAGRGDLARGRDLLLGLLAEHERNGQFLAGYVRLLAQDDKTSARRWLQRLERAEPGSRRTRLLKHQLSPQVNE